MIITRKYTFSSCHRLHNIKLSDEENEKVFGKCNNLNGHGHNYKLYLSLKGPINSNTGMVINFNDLDEYVNLVLNKLDHKNLDLDVNELKNVITTTENLAIYIWNQLKNNLPKLLYMIKIKETDRNSVKFYG